MRHWVEVIFTVPVEWEEALPALLEELGFTGIWMGESPPSQQSVLRAYCPEDQWCSRIEKKLADYMERLSHAFPGGTEKGGFEIKVIEEEDWASRWLPFFEPIHIGPVWIRPSQKRVTLSPGDLEIILDPGQAFGTGHHETTRLCMEAFMSLHERLKKDGPIMDLGTGSGILAMFAAKIGFHNITALDIDTAACETARRNLAVNGLLDDSDGASKGPITIFQGSVDAVEKEYSLIFANLTTRDVVPLSQAISERLSHEGWLIVSGVLETEKKIVIEEFRRQGVRLWEQYRENEWACMVFQKSVTGSVTGK